MAKAVAKGEDTTFTLTKSKVKRLIVRNFRSIGPEPVSIDLDDIVVLVGPNNAGKSTILRAYEVVMSHATAEGRLKLEDFPGEVVDANHLPEIELQTFVWEDLPAEHWLHKDEETGSLFVRERWRWEEPNKDPKRQGRRADAEDWDERVPWGAPNVAKSRRPIPHRVDAFSSPEEQGEKISKLMQDILAERAARAAGEEVSAIEKLTEQIRELQKQIVEDSQDEIVGLQEALSGYVKEIFVGFKVLLDTRPEQISDKNVSLFAAKPIIRMGPDGGHMAPLDKQGSGARRTLLWSSLKIASERQPDVKKVKKSDKGAEPENEVLSRPHVLLLDEPEICLHPAAVRDACRVLYDLASEGSGWQVMVTTHSPPFIDVSRDNTTIVRVARAQSGSISGTTVFRPDKVKLSDEDKELLKLLNQWDPYVGEFFFGGDTIVVEGDTEYSAFREIINSDLQKYRNVHIVRARGKWIIPIITKILNQFGSSYAILHDTDRPKDKNGKANSAWSANEAILKAVKSAPGGTQVRLAASVVDFEHAMFGTSASSDKPYKTVMLMRNDPVARDRVKWVFDYLLYLRTDPPAGILPYETVDELLTAVAAEIPVEGMGGQEGAGEAATAEA
ncbi:ATP-dependent endonuclease [Kaistia defluvii]|uniref:ATP-dependent nuclease n=1 Tax=Kaistia defluvii TaxID=410841 RepID=UPI0022566492|nr:ATP-dependent endonuclease [Kaistia defluvii]MCX5518072.1 ATP-dependent endonuclease [Kaistia defluvii]